MILFVSSHFLVRAFIFFFSLCLLPSDCVCGGGVASIQLSWPSDSGLMLGYVWWGLILYEYYKLSDWASKSWRQIHVARVSVPVQTNFRQVAYNRPQPQARRTAFPSSDTWLGAWMWPPTLHEEFLAFLSLQELNLLFVSGLGEQ